VELVATDIAHATGADGEEDELQKAGPRHYVYLPGGPHFEVEKRVMASSTPTNEVRV
jgi:hypothetical protein